MPALRPRTPPVAEVAGTFKKLSRFLTVNLMIIKSISFVTLGGWQERKGRCRYLRHKVNHFLQHPPGCIDSTSSGAGNTTRDLGFAFQSILGSLKFLKLGLCAPRIRDRQPTPSPSPSLSSNANVWTLSAALKSAAAHYDPRL